MGKNPTSQFYWNDLSRDLKPLSLEAKGAWIEILCHLHYSKTRGIETLDVYGWAGIIGGRKTVEETALILLELKNKNIGDIEVLITCGYVVEKPVENVLISPEGRKRGAKSAPFSIPSNAHVTIKNRRMAKEEKARQDNVNRVRKHRKKF